MKILQTIPSVGPRTAEAVAAFLPHSRQFKTTKQVLALAGWVTDLWHELAIPVIVASTTGEAWAWNHVKRKTDKAMLLNWPDLPPSGIAPRDHAAQVGATTQEPRRPATAACRESSMC